MKEKITLVITKPNPKVVVFEQDAPGLATDYSVLKELDYKPGEGMLVFEVSVTGSAEIKTFIVNFTVAMDSERSLIYTATRSDGEGFTNIFINQEEWRYYTPKEPREVSRTFEVVVVGETDLWSQEVPVRFKLEGHWKPSKVVFLPREFFS